LLLRQYIIQRLFLWSIIGVFIFIVLGSLLYLLSDYTDLVKWYLSLNDCFYLKDLWQARYFSPSVKHQGNYFATLAILIALSGIVYTLYRWRYIPLFIAKLQLAKPIKYSVFLGYVLVLLGAFLAWCWGIQQTPPSGDELLSVVHCASLPSFQTIAYYMLPNNHLYFNVLNGFLFYTIPIDGLQSGRLISLLAYLVVVATAFYWFSCLMPNRLLAFVAVVPFALGFTTWAFSFQARGYEIQLCCAWLSFLLLQKYRQSGDRKTALLIALFNLMGFAFVLSYLYYFIAQMIFVSLMQAYRRKLDFVFWQYQAFAMMGVFLLYTPALCFSGLQAITQNEYVKPLNELSNAALWAIASEKTKYFINSIFSFIIHENHKLNFILFASPLLLIFSKQNKHRQLAVFYLVLWLSWFSMCWLMKRFPFNRNMIIHHSLSLAIVLYTYYVCLSWLIANCVSMHWRLRLSISLYVLPLAYFVQHQLKWNKSQVCTSLYFMDVRDIEHEYQNDIAHTIPAKASIAFAPERYCMLYYAQKNHLQVHTCMSGNEDYYINIAQDTLPASIARNYKLIKRGIGNDVYQHR
jgi:hypothetical protein